MNLRQLGRLRILRALTEAREMSRPDLVRRTGLSRATVSSVVFDLIAEQVVAEAPAVATSAKPGRPPLTLSLAPTAAYAFGVDIGHDHVRSILCDLGGTCVCDDTTELDVDDAPTAALDAATRLIDRALGEAKVPRSALLGIGVGIACPVDRHTGQLHANGIMPGWVGLRPGDALAERTGLPVQVINDANACVLAERSYGAAQTWDDVVYVRLSAGIGAGIVCDGQMLLGHEGLSGEVGHLTIEPGGALCRCGNRGCLETIASPAAIATLLSRSWERTVTRTDLARLINERDRGALRAIDDAGDAIGQALATTVMTLNPRLILVGGELAAAGDVLLDSIRRALQRNTVASHHRPIEIAVSALGDSAAVRGAAALILADAPKHLSDRSATRL